MFNRGLLAAACLALCACVGMASSAEAQSPRSRITQEIQSTSMAALPGSVNPLANSRTDQGSVSGSTQLNGMTMYFAPSASQKAELDALVKAQQTPGSGEYHQWLTPATYAARFGMSATDLAKAKSWLEQQGFTVNRVANSGNAIVFSGTAAQVQSAFGTELHHYKVNGETHIANATAVQIPSALAGVVQGIHNISDFRPKAQHVRMTAAATTAKPAYSSTSTSQYFFLAPGDIATIYDINAAYNAGYTGTGQSIAIMGESAVEVSDIENFQNAAGMTVKDPTMVLVPDSGASTVSSGDEAESDLDLEWSGAIAKGATIYFVYVGNDSNYNVFDSLEYAIDTKISPVLSISYGACEADLTTSDIAEFEQVLEQGVSQGQSIIASSGDSGSTACMGSTTGLTVAEIAADEVLSVNYPASSQYATAIGGTEFEADKTDPSEYWESASGSDILTSALKYIPEEAWNDDSSQYGLSASGGGVSTIVPKPSWQTGVTGIPTGSFRYVPDISLDASNEWDPYLFCSSDQKDTGIAGSCSNGFYGSAGATYNSMTLAGGTSFGAPIFAGMLAITNQKLNSTGQGLINSTLYTLAANSTTYASIFHDITTGNNECTAGTTYCSSTTGGETNYTTTTGYDEVTGLGTVDFDNLLTAWPTSTSAGAALAASTTVVTAATTTPAANASDALTITVAGPSTSTATPTGTVSLQITDPSGNVTTQSVTLTNGTGTSSYLSAVTGTAVIVATYSGDSTFAASTGTLVLGTSSTEGFSLSATDVSVTAGGSGTSTITVTPSNYTGTVEFPNISTDSTSLQTYGCYTYTEADVTSATATATGTLTLYTSQSACSNVQSAARTTKHAFVKAGAAKTAKNSPAGSSSRWPVGSAVAMAGLLCVGLAGKRRRLAGLLGCLLLLGGIGMVSGCGSSNSSSGTTSSTEVAPGTYTLTVTGEDTVTNTIAATTSLTLTVQ